MAESFNTADFTFVRASTVVGESSGYSISFYANATVCGGGTLIGQVSGLTANSSAVYRLPLQPAGAHISVVAAQPDAWTAQSNCYVLATQPLRYSVDTGHFYEYVPTPGLQWTAANATAPKKSVLGAQGHLATIGDANENAFVQSVPVGGFRAWIGLTYNSETGTFGWVDGTPGGPDSGENWYHNWSTGEPNHAGGQEFYVEMFDNGAWNDNQNLDPVFPTSGYLVEYEPAVVVLQF